MTREDIIRMAQEANFYDSEIGGNEDGFVRFAALVAAAEREKVAAWMVNRSYATGHGDTVEDLLKELEWQIREAEREACARLCYELDKKTVEGDTVAYVGGWIDGTKDCAAAIRARGEK